MSHKSLLSESFLLFVTTRRLEKIAMESKKISRRQLLRVGAFATAGAALAACAPPAAAPAAAPAAKPAEAKPTDAPAAAAPAAESGGKAIIWWDIQNGKNGELFDTIVKDWNTANPKAQVKREYIENDAFKTKMAAAMQAGAPPDLFQSWGGGVLKSYIDAGLVRDITEDLKQNDWGKSFAPASLGLYTFEGKNYATMWTMGMVGMWYNKALFKEAGVEVPKTWADFLIVVQKLKDHFKGEVAPVALGNKDKWPGHFYWSYAAIRLGGKEAFDAAANRTGKFTDATFVEGGKKLKELVDLAPFPKGAEAQTFDQQSAQMATRKAAMELMGQWTPGSIEGQSEDKKGLGADLGLFPFPMIDGGKGDASDVLGGGDGIAIGKNAPNEAIDYLRYFTNLENQKKLTALGSLSPVKGTEDSISNPDMKEVSRLAANAKYFQLYYDQYLPPAVGEAVKDASQALLLGKLSPEDTAKAVEDVAAVEMKK